MIVFNTVAGIQVALAAIPAVLIYAAMHYGLASPSAGWWAAAIALVCLVPIDLLTRASNMGGDEETGEAGMGASALFLPSGGGHIFFLPMFLIAAVLGVALCAGVINP